MPGRTLVLDSWAVVAFFEGQRGAERVEAELAAAREGRAALSISTVNLGEVWYSLARAHSPAAADRVVAELSALGVETVAADWALAREAARLKSRGRIAYADCFAAALARRRRAVLLTGDPEFRRLEGEAEIAWL